MVLLWIKQINNFLQLLQQDGSLSLQQIAGKLHLTTTPCWNRIKRLENDGLIKQRVALLTPEKVGLSLIIFVQIKTQQHSETWFEDFVMLVKGFLRWWSSIVWQEYDYMLKVLVKDMGSYDRFYKTLVNNVSGLTDVNSSFTMRQLKYTTELPL